MAYPTIDATAPDSDAEVRCPGSHRLQIQISNQSVYLTFGTADAPGRPVVYDEPPERYLPVVGEVVRDFDSFKYRAYTPAAQLPAGATQAHVILTPRA